MSAGWSARLHTLGVGRVDGLGKSLLKTFRRSLLDGLGHDGRASSVRDVLVLGGVGVVDLEGETQDN